MRERKGSSTHTNRDRERERERDAETRERSGREDGKKKRLNTSLEYWKLQF
jgi:hypothetical protein